MSKHRLYYYLLAGTVCGALILSQPASLHAETLTLRNGNKVTGKITVDKPTYYVIKTDDGRTLKIPKKWVTGGGPANQSGNSSGVPGTPAKGGIFGFLNMGAAMSEAQGAMLEAQKQQMELQQKIMEMQQEAEYDSMGTEARDSGSGGGIPEMQGYPDMTEYLSGESDEDSSSTKKKTKRKSQLQQSHENTMDSVGRYE